MVEGVDRLPGLGDMLLHSLCMTDLAQVVLEVENMLVI